MRAPLFSMQLETRFDLTKEAREFLEKKLAEIKVKVERSEKLCNVSVKLMAWSLWREGKMSLSIAWWT